MLESTCKSFKTYDWLQVLHVKLVKTWKSAKQWKRDYVEKFNTIHHDEFIILRVMQIFERSLKTHFQVAIKILDKHFYHGVTMKLLF